MNPLLPPNICIPQINANSPKRKRRQAIHGIGVYASEEEQRRGDHRVMVEGKKKKEVVFESRSYVHDGK